MIEGWSNNLCSKFDQSPPRRTNCPREPYCLWHNNGYCALNTKTEDPPFMPSDEEINNPSLFIARVDRHNSQPELVREYEPELEPELEPERLRSTFLEEARKLERTIEETRQELLRQNKARQEREARERESEELERLEANMNTPPVSPPESPRLDELREILRKPEKKQPERLYPSEVSGNVPTLDVPSRTRVQPREQPVPEAGVVNPRDYQIAQPIPQAEVVDPRDYQIARPIPQAEVVTPYQRDTKQQNIFLKNQYYLIRPNEYGFDPNSNVPRRRNRVRSIKDNSSPITEKKKSGVSGRIQKKTQTKSKTLDKPAPKDIPVKKVSKSVPPTFAKTINQLLPIILIFAVLFYLVFALRKWNKIKL